MHGQYHARVRAAAGGCLWRNTRNRCATTLQPAQRSPVRYKQCMGVATLAISIIAVVIASATALFAYQQARAARQQATSAVEQATAAMEAVQIEQGRWHAERKPTLSGVIDFVQPSAHVFRLNLDSDRSVIISKLRYLDDGVASADPFGDTQPETLVPGGATHRLVTVRDPHPENAAVEITCSDPVSDDTWTSLLTVPIFPELADRVPQLRFSFEQKYPPPHRLIVVLTSGERIESLEVMVGTDSGLRFGAGRLSTNTNDLTPGRRVELPVRVDSEHPDEVELKIRCIGMREERWQFTERVSVPRILSQAQAPKFRTTLERSGSIHLVRVTLTSRWPLSSVRITLEGIRNTVFIGLNSERYIHAQIKNMNPDATFERKVEIGPWAGGLEPWFTLLLECEGKPGERWEISETVSVPNHLM
jgi:hypothetical protein